MLFVANRCDRTGRKKSCKYRRLNCLESTKVYLKIDDPFICHLPKPPFSSSMHCTITKMRTQNSSNNIGFYSIFTSLVHKQHASETIKKQHHVRVIAPPQHIIQNQSISSTNSPPKKKENGSLQEPTRDDPERPRTSQTASGPQGHPRGNPSTPQTPPDNPQRPPSSA